MRSHGDNVLDQFTRQASLFQATHRSAEAAINCALEVSGVSANDTVLDVACGPGVLACAFARVAMQVTGIDITPAMLDAARELQASTGVANVSWQHCDVYRMSFPDASFSMVISRYAFHHLEQPGLVLAEMARVCTPSGQVMLIDSAPAQEKAAGFNRLERLRDPSHTRALTADEVESLFRSAGLRIVRRHLYAWEVQAQGLMDRSFPADGDRGRLLALYAGDVGTDDLGMNARYLDGVLHVTFPTLITVGVKSG